MLRPIPHLPFHPHRVLQMLRENLEEEAIIMKDVPDWKVGPGQGAWGSRPLQKHRHHGKPVAERSSGGQA